MIWRILTPHEEATIVEISDGFFEWLRVRVDDPQVRAFDPYVDVTLDVDALTRWKSALARAIDARSLEVEDEFRASRQLPRDAAARQLLLREWVKRELADDPHYCTLRELEATIALALETGAKVTTIGD